MLSDYGGGVAGVKISVGSTANLKEFKVMQRCHQGLQDPVLWSISRDGQYIGSYLWGAWPFWDRPKLKYLKLCQG